MSRYIFDIDVILNVFKLFCKSNWYYTVKLTEISSQIQTEIPYQFVCFLRIFQAHTLYGAKGIVNKMGLDLGKHNRHTAFLQFRFYNAFFGFEATSLQFQLICFGCGIDALGDQAQYHKQSRNKQNKEYIF